MGIVIAGKWELTQRLGAGGFGEVFEAWHPALDELFAIKFLRAEHRDTEARKHFLEEARAMARLQGEHLVLVSDYGELPGKTPYFVMERLWGKTLRRRLEGEPPLPFTEAFEIAQGMLEGLAQVHTSGLIHGDIKPENIFLSDKGSRIRLLDFGLAKISALTSKGVAGTPPYMAPEILLEAEPADARSDLYAVGVVLFEMLSGRLPRGHRRMNLDGARQAWDAGSAPSLRIHRGDIPDALSNLVAQAISKDPQTRPEAASAMLHQLRASMGQAAPAPSINADSDRPNLQALPTTPDPTPQEQKRRTWLRAPASRVTWIAVLLVLLASVLWRWTWPWSFDPTPAKDGLWIVAPYWTNDEVDSVFDAACKTLGGQRARASDESLPVRCTRVSVWNAAHERLLAAADDVGTRMVVIIDDKGVTLRSTSHHQDLPLLAKLDGLELPRDPSVTEQVMVVLHAIVSGSEFEPSEIPPLDPQIVGSDWATVSEAVRATTGVDDPHALDRRERLARCDAPGFYCHLAKLLYASTPGLSCTGAEEYLAEVAAQGNDPVLRIPALLEQAACRVEGSDTSPLALSEAESQLNDAFGSRPEDICLRVAALGTVTRIALQGGDASGVLREATEIPRAKRTHCPPGQQSRAFASRGAALVEHEHWCKAANAFHQAFDVSPKSASTLLDWAETSLLCNSVVDESKTALLGALRPERYEDIHARLSVAYMRWILTRQPADAMRVLSLHDAVPLQKIPLVRGVAEYLLQIHCSDTPEPCTYMLLSQPKREGDNLRLQKALDLERARPTGTHDP